MWALTVGPWALPGGPACAGDWAKPPPGAAERALGFPEAPQALPSPGAHCQPRSAVLRELRLQLRNASTVVTTPAQLQDSEAMFLLLVLLTRLGELHADLGKSRCLLPLASQACGGWGRGRGRGGLRSLRDYALVQATGPDLAPAPLSLPTFFYALFGIYGQKSRGSLQAENIFMSLGWYSCL